MTFKLQKIKGDASFRNFYRVVINKKRKIIILAQKEKYKNLVAYSAINKFLRNNKILAPKTFSYDFRKGIIIIEDFGDLSFHKILTKSKNKLFIYKELVDLLIKIQKIKPKKKIKNFDKTTHFIDNYSIKYLNKESNLFFDWYLVLVSKKKNLFNFKKKTKKILAKLYKKINFSNKYYVHRDYHSQNLIKFNKKIGVIDTQDALIGNPAYDLVSLIDDPRIKTSKKLKQQIFKYYLKKSPLINKHNLNKFQEDFNILSVQRSLKIIGIFSRLFRRDKKKKYLKFIPYTWQLLEERMKSKKLSDLRKIFNTNINKNTRRKNLFR